MAHMKRKSSWMKGFRLRKAVEEGFIGYSEGEATRASKRTGRKGSISPKVSREYIELNKGDV